MARYTTTLNEYLQSELQKRGHSEFYNAGRLTFNKSKYGFIQKILKYDHDVSCIVDECIFKGFKLENDKVDKHFKKMFITRFLDREINRQTIDAFSSQVLYVTLTHEEYIDKVFGSEYYKYFEQHVDFNGDTVGNVTDHSTEHGETTQSQDNNTKDIYSDESHNTHSDNSLTTSNDTSNNTNSSDTKNSGSSTDDNRSANATLPQSEVNINVDNTSLNYADENTISRNKNVNNSDTTNTGESETKNNGTSETTSSGKSDTNGSGDRNSDFKGLTDGESDNERNATSDNTSNTKTLTKSYLLDNLKTIYDMKEQLYNTYDKKCFLHIW